MFQDTVSVKVLDGLDAKRVEGAEVKINNIPIGVTKESGVILFEATNCTTLSFSVDNLKLYEPFELETQLVLPSALQLKIRPKVVSTPYSSGRKTPYPYEAIFLVNKSLRACIFHYPGLNFTILGLFERY